MRESASNSRLVGVEAVDNPAQAEDGDDEHANLRKTFARRSPCVLLGGESAEDIVVLVELQDTRIKPYTSTSNCHDVPVRRSFYAPAYPTSRRRGP